MNRAERIRAILTEHFKPSHLELRDVSHKHAGHAGARPEGQTHYELVIRSAAFNHLSKIKCHQAVYTVLAAEFQQGLHALAIDAASSES